MDRRPVQDDIKATAPHRQTVRAAEQREHGESRVALTSGAALVLQGQIGGAVHLAEFEERTEPESE